MRGRGGGHEPALIANILRQLIEHPLSYPQTARSSSSFSAVQRKSDFMSSLSKAAARQTMFIARFQRLSSCFRRLPSLTDRSPSHHQRASRFSGSPCDLFHSNGSSASLRSFHNAVRR
jgi:hypothetical protein